MFAEKFTQHAELLNNVYEFQPQKSHSEVKREFVPAEPPKENPWMKRKQEREQHISSSKSGRFTQAQLFKTLLA